MRPRFPALLALALLGLALGACSTLSESERRSADAHRDLGERYLQSGEVELSIRELRLALGIHERDADAHFTIGEAYRRKQQYELAERHLRRALSLDPTLLDARLNLGVIFLEQERWPDAIRETQPLADDPTFLNPARALVNLGWAHYNSSNLEEAESYYRRALALNRSQFQTFLNLGIVLYEKNEVVEAVTQFQHALTLLEERPPGLFAAAVAQTRFRLAMAHVRLGQRDRAIDELRAVADGGSDTEWAQKSREYLAVLQ